MFRVCWYRQCVIRDRYVESGVQLRYQWRRDRAPGVRTRLFRVFYMKILAKSNQECHALEPNIVHPGCSPPSWTPICCSVSVSLGLFIQCRHLQSCRRCNCGHGGDQWPRDSSLKMHMGSWGEVSVVRLSQLVGHLSASSQDLVGVDIPATQFFAPL